MNRRRFLTTSSTTVAASFVSTVQAATGGKARVAVIGHTGRGDFGHGLDTVWLELPEAEIVAVADADKAGLERAVKKLKLESGFSDYRAMLAEVKPEIVSVALRHLDQHHAMVMASIEAGVRGIYMEKPFCRTLVEADEMLEACRSKKVKLAVAHRNRYHPVLPKVKELLADGLIGRVLEIRLRGKEDRRGGGEDLWVLGTHLFNLAHYFAGAPVACSATVFQDGDLVTADDVKEGAEGIGPLAGNEVHARFEMESGVPVFFDSIQNAGTKEAGFGAQIVGSEGIIDLRIDKDPLAHLLQGSPFSPKNSPGSWVPISSGGVGVPEPIPDLGHLVGHHVMQAEDLIAAVREDRAPICDVEQAHTTVEMVAAVFESHRLGGQRVEFPLKTRVNPLTLL